MSERLITSKNAFFNVRPGTVRGYARSPAHVDEKRHPATARYARMSGQYSSSPALPDLWQKGYERFGDEFESILTGITSRKPTEYAKALLQLDDLWKLVGLRWGELLPHEQLAWEHAKSDTRSRALQLVARRKTPVEFPELLAWSGLNRVEVLHSRGWAESILASVFTKVAERRNRVRFYYKSPLTEPTTEEVLAVARAGITPDELFTAVKEHGLTLTQARIHITEGLPLEYVLAAF